MRRAVGKNTRTCDGETVASEESSHRREPSGCACEGTTRSQNQGAVQGSRTGLPEYCHCLGGALTGSGGKEQAEGGCVAAGEA
eukprot:6481817-Amphidinium_carterae.4